MSKSETMVWGGLLVIAWGIAIALCLVGCGSVTSGSGPDASVKHDARPDATVPKDVAPPRDVAIDAVTIGPCEAQPGAGWQLCADSAGNSTIKRGNYYCVIGCVGTGVADKCIFNGNEVCVTSCAECK